MGGRRYSRAIGDETTHPLPEDPALAAAARALDAAGHWAEIVDSGFRHAFTTDELRLSYGQTLGLAAVPLGAFYNEAARIEACASGGRLLASKNLIERLDPQDAAALGINPDRLTYTPVADLSTATEKARHDAPAIAVCEV